MADKKKSTWLERKLKAINQISDPLKVKKLSEIVYKGVKKEK